MPEEIDAFDKPIRRVTLTRDEGMQLFRQRMIRDGRLEELDALLAKYRSEGKRRFSTIYAAMREMGYSGPAKERKLHERAKAQALQDWRRKKDQKYTTAYRKKMRNKALDEVMDTLKPNALPEQENDWVTSHRKLFHVGQLLGDDSEESMEELRAARRLSAADISSAPSQAAVNMLLSALRDPDGWMEKKRDAHKSKTGAGTAATDNDTSDAEDDTSEMEALMRDIGSNHK